MTRAQAWLIPLDADGGALPPRVARLLGPLEREEVARFRCAGDRRLARLSRAAGRCAASALLGQQVAPEAWSFRRTGSGGRLLRAPDGRAVHVGIADDPGALLVSADTECGSGVDLACGRTPVLWAAIAQRFFAPTECVALRALPPGEAWLAFRLLWTGKEAVAKARGVPLAELLGTALADRRIEAARWRTDGLDAGEFRIRWRAWRTYLLAFCGPPHRPPALFRTLPLPSLLRAIDGPAREAGTMPRGPAATTCG